MKCTANRFLSVLAALAFLALPIDTASGQIFKWKDKSGAVNFSDNADVTLKNNNVERIEVKQQVIRYSDSEENTVADPSAGTAPAIEEEAPSDEAKKQKEITKNGVEVANFELSPSVGGTAVIVATIKNNMPYPAAGLRMDVILYTNDRKRIPDIEIPYREGKIRADWLGPGETAELEYVTNINQNDVAGYNYQVVFASIAPTQDKQGDKVTELLVNQKTGESRVAPKIKPEGQKGAM
ncbi:MAG: DUF4124 domain-containing protein [Nitrospinota bacterium]|nr:DUF4124 domain-containing protein [Nitrospinota bacterium]